MILRKLFDYLSAPGSNRIAVSDKHNFDVTYLTDLQIARFMVFRNSSDDPNYIKDIEFVLSELLPGLDFNTSIHDDELINIARLRSQVRDFELDFSLSDIEYVRDYSYD